MTGPGDSTDERQTPARVLVVDDEAEVRELLLARLEMEGYLCREADSAESALARLREEACDVVLSDLRMSGRSGLALLADIRAHHAGTAVILATGESDARVAIEAMKQGAADYLLKPFQFELVVAAVERAIEKTRLERELETYRRDLERMVAERTDQLRAAMGKIEATYDATLEALGAALDMRATEVAGHSLRVSRYAEEMARRLGFAGEDLRNVLRGAFLHDIGKMGIPDAILLKRGRLTPEERVVMEGHVQLGYDMVRRIEFLSAAAEVVLNHQERYDGAGYPRGVGGEQIPLPARIFSVADALDAMTSNRPYRAALPFAVARAEIVREAGRQFDPRVVEIFLAVPEERWRRIRDEVDQVSYTLQIHHKALDPDLAAAAPGSEPEPAAQPDAPSLPKIPAASQGPHLVPAPAEARRAAAGR